MQQQAHVHILSMELGVVVPEDLPAYCNGEICDCV